MLLQKLIRIDVAKRKPHNETLSLFYRFPAIPLWRNTQITYVNVGSVVDWEGDVSRYFLVGLVWVEIKAMDGTKGNKETRNCIITSSLTWDAKDQYHNPHVWNIMERHEHRSASTGYPRLVGAFNDFFRTRRVTTLVKIYISTLSVTTMCRLWWVSEKRTASICSAQTDLHVEILFVPILLVFK
jgi:hypothetical protein